MRTWLEILLVEEDEVLSIVCVCGRFGPWFEEVDVVGMAVCEWRTWW
jgi:hypothetical protein